MPLIEDKVNIEGIAEAAVQYKNELTNHINEVMKIKDSFEKKISELELEVQKKTAQLEDMKNAINENKTQANSIIAEYQKQFSSSESDRQKIFNEKTQSFQKSWDKLIKDEDLKIRTMFDKYGKLFDDALIKFNNDANGIITFMKEKKEKASEIVGIIGNIGVTGNYKRVADEERKKANIFQWLAVGLMASSVGYIGYWTYHIPTDNGFDWKLTLFRISLALVVSLPAVYCAQQSRIHRNVERTNRRLELELASLEPFLENLEKSQKESLKQELAKKYFGKEEIPPKPEKDSPSVPHLLKLLEMCMKHFTK